MFEDPVNRLVMFYTVSLLLMATFGEILHSLHPHQRLLVRQLEKTEIKIVRNRNSQLFNQTLMNKTKAAPQLNILKGVKDRTNYLFMA